MKKFLKPFSLFAALVMLPIFLGGCLGLSAGGAVLSDNRFALTLYADNTVSFAAYLEGHESKKSNLADIFSQAGWEMTKTEDYQFYAHTNTSHAGIDSVSRPSGKENWKYGFFFYTAEVSFSNPYNTLLSGNLSGLKTFLDNNSSLIPDDVLFFQFEADSVYTRTNRDRTSGYYHVFETKLSEAGAGSSGEIKGRYYSLNPHGWYVLAALAGGIFIGAVFFARFLKNKKSAGIAGNKEII